VHRAPRDQRAADLRPTACVGKPEERHADDYDRREELFTGEFYVPAAPGRWFIALQTSANGVAYQGYGAQGLGAQWFVDVKAGEVSDLSSAPITLTRQ
jgi:hypothetical protein